MLRIEALNDLRPEQTASAPCIFMRSRKFFAPRLLRCAKLCPMDPWPRKSCLLIGVVAIATFGEMVIFGGITPSSPPRIGAAADDWQTRIVGALGVAVGATLIDYGLQRRK
jgi:hypothetical protein